MTQSTIINLQPNEQAQGYYRYYLFEVNLM